MAWASKKQYAIMMNSEEGKDLAEQLPDLEQDDFNVKFGELLGKTGQSYSESDDNDYFEKREYEENKHFDNKIDDESFDEDDIDFSQFSWLPSSNEDDDSYENKLKKGRESLNEFDMPKDEGWEESDFGEKSFVKNKDTDNEMFIQYNGEDVEGYPEYISGYIDEYGDYITKKFSNLSDAKSFVDTYESEKTKNYKKDFLATYDELRSAVEQQIKDGIYEGELTLDDFNSEDEDTLNFLTDALYGTAENLYKPKFIGNDLREQIYNKLKSDRKLTKLSNVKKKTEKTEIEKIDDDLKNLHKKRDELAKKWEKSSGKQRQYLDEELADIEYSIEDLEDRRYFLINGKDWRD